MHFPVKIRDIKKIAKKNSSSISVFGYENKETHPIYVLKKCYEEKHVGLLLTAKKGEIHYVLIKDFNTFMYDHVLHRGRKHFYHCCLPTLSTKEILKRHIKDCFKINGKQRFLMYKKGKYGKSRNYERKIKSTFMIYTDFEFILVPEDNGKQNPQEPYANKFRKCNARSYDYKLGYADDKCSKPFKT